MSYQAYTTDSWVNFSDRPGTGLLTTQSYWNGHKTRLDGIMIIPSLRSEIWTFFWPSQISGGGPSHQTCEITSWFPAGALLGSLGQLSLPSLQGRYSDWPKVSNQHGFSIKNLTQKSITKTIIFHIKTNQRPMLSWMVNTLRKMLFSISNEWIRRETDANYSTNISNRQRHPNHADWVHQLRRIWSCHSHSVGSFSLHAISFLLYSSP